MSAGRDDRARRDAEYDAMIRRLRADEIARRTGRPAEEVLAEWAAEDAAFARRMRPRIPGDPGNEVLGPHFRIASEMRGETIHYLETDAAGSVVRRTSMQFFWTRGYKIVVDDMRRWWRPAERADAEMTQDERRAVVERVVAWARREQGVALEVAGADW